MRERAPGLRTFPIPTSCLRWILDLVTIGLIKGWCLCDTGEDEEEFWCYLGPLFTCCFILSKWLTVSSQFDCKKAFKFPSAGPGFDFRYRYIISVRTTCYFEESFVGWPSYWACCRFFCSRIVAIFILDIMPFCSVEPRISSKFGAFFVNFEFCFSGRSLCRLLKSLCTLKEKFSLLSSTI